MIKKIIIILIFILLILILVTFFISNYLKNKTPKTEIKNFSPTSIDHRDLRRLPDDISISPRLIPPTTSVLKIDQIVAKTKILNQDDLQALAKLNSILPYQTDDFAVDYSPFLNQYFVSKKNPDADQKIAQWAVENNLSQLIEDKNLFIFTNQPVAEYKKSLEEQVVKAKEEALAAFYLTPTKTEATPSPNLSLAPADNSDLAKLRDVLNAFFSIFSTSYNLSPTETINSTTESTQPMISPEQNNNIIYPAAPRSLTDIFYEVGQKVGVPPKILEAVMRIECPTTFNLSANEIATYSQPGGRAPFCLTNSCSATGTMQMTIGIDDRGDTSCPRCGAGFCPNQWAIYGGTIKNYGYSHQPNPLNIKDIVYSAAAKLKNDSRSSDPLNWTQSQVFRAAEHYYGRCDDNHRYSWLGNRTYCEYVWWYYKNR
ncbi:MAG: hypothetical protein QHH09_04610 [Microgenomates group bacterium]|nr:hypothetical protein [Microgenomates group bacterium]